eukprot:TRINITY_DN2022_c0_g1_i1.p1 TRINITY_DN2022_c0_g1~~TRINITY_DN2022_c0_g1_i1.p1  ORF type:complete len:138 (-),score=55.38 TRINITY_DN2022_c0_g1_i1:235-648(-)
MVKFMKSGKVVIVLQGKYAGRKAVVVRNYDDGTETRKYGHAVIAGIDKYPRKVTRSMSKKKIARRSKIKPFVKTMNYNHLMPTRYQLDLDLKKAVAPEDLEVKGKRPQVKRAVKSVLQRRYQSGEQKYKWFFTKLRF